MVARHFCNESILRDCEKRLSHLMRYACFIFHLMRYAYFILHALCDTHALCFIKYACFILYAIRMLYALCDTPVSYFTRKVCSIRRAWLWDIYRRFCICEELTKSIIYWLDQSTDIDYPTICFALTHRIYHLCSSSNHLLPAT